MPVEWRYCRNRDLTITIREMMILEPKIKAARPRHGRNVSLCWVSWNFRMRDSHAFRHIRLNLKSLYIDGQAHGLTRSVIPAGGSSADALASGRARRCRCALRVAISDD